MGSLHVTAPPTGAALESARAAGAPFHSVGQPRAAQVGPVRSPGPSGPGGRPLRRPAGDRCPVARLDGPRLCLPSPGRLTLPVGPAGVARAGAPEPLIGID